MSRVWFVTPEVSPFSKAGGLGDVSGALPKAIATRWDIAVISVLYQFMDMSSLQPSRRFGDGIAVEIDRTRYDVHIYEATLPHSEIPVIFIDEAKRLRRPGIYGDEHHPHGYPDNPLRFILFCKAVVALFERAERKPELWHLNDYPTALLAPLSRELSPSPRTLLTIHNASYQGLYEPGILPQTGLPPTGYYPGGPFEFFGKVNFLKAGIEFADRLTTVSPTYAQEITESAEFGCGLEGVFLRRRTAMTGILNGIDADLWNPETDPSIVRRYSGQTLSEKSENRVALLRECALPEARQHHPILSVISRLVPQKGIDLLMEIFPDLMGLDVTLVQLGTGLPEYHEFFLAMEKEYPDRVRATLRFDEPLSHRMTAGSDFFLMPSRFEPSGLSQQYSLRYGTLPVVRATGGLKDAVVDLDEAPDSGVGFRFYPFEGAAFLNAVRRAVHLFRQDPRRLSEARRRAMAIDFSWRRAATSYGEIYQSLVPSVSDPGERA